MRYWLTLAVTLLTVSLVSGEKQSSHRLTVPLFNPHVLDMNHSVHCSSLAGVRLSQGLNQRNQLVAEAKAGTDQLELKLVGDTIFVQEKSRTDGYEVVGKTDIYLSAVFVRKPDKYNPSPVVKSIVMDKSTGFGVWSISEPADLISDIPYAEMAYLTCR
jgi:hypothetical protein